ncbi:MAG: hypothetical protein A2Y59_00565 [Chloroflexi bacterium RBG_13_52_14]|nr:MAG: hypothetical protein A2Y59_00565 [Chloroflexi bacterium RBG_13_52_14]
MSTTPKLGEFGGPVDHGLERPSCFSSWTSLSETPQSIDLPLEAEFRGWKIWYINNGQFGRKVYVLYDRWGAILHEWPEGLCPSLGEVFEVCNELLGKGGA